MEVSFNKEVEKLMRILEFDQATCEDLILTFIDQSLKGFLEIKEALASKDTNKALRKLHQLKGAAGAIHMEVIRKEIEEAESLLKEGNTDEASMIINKVSDAGIFKK